MEIMSDTKLKVSNGRLSVINSQLKKGYKQTEVGVIPVEWEVKKLGDCLLTNPEYGINAASVDYSDSLPVYIRITDITEDGTFSPEKITSVKNPNSHKYLLATGDIVFARTGASTGKTYLYNSKDGELVFAGFLIKVKANPNKLIPAYLANYTKTSTYRNWVRVMSMRSGQPGINGNEYAQLLIPLPPLVEQLAISQTLSYIDALISALDILIAKKRNIKQSVMQQLLTGKKRLLGFTGDWVGKKLENLGKVIRGASPRPQGHPKYYGGNVPRLMVEDVTPMVDFLTEEGAKKSRPCKAGTLTIVCSGTVGIPSFLAVDACIHDGFLALIEINKNISVDYLFHQLMILKERLERSATHGGVFTNLTTSILKKFTVAIPTLPEQQAIAQILNDIDSEIVRLKQQRDKTKLLKQGMMQELLTGKTRLI